MALSDDKFRSVCEEACRLLRKLAPRKTGNLAFNAITIEFPSPDVCVIYVNESIAPYMPFTTLPWKAPRWGGKKNPNEDWWQNAVDAVARYIAEQVDGKLKKEQDYV